MCCIVICGRPCAGSSSLASALSASLNIRHFSVGDYVKGHLADSDDVDLQKAYGKQGVLSDEESQRSIDALQLKIARKGNVVIDSKLGILLLKDFCDLAIWLTAPMNLRSDRFAKRAGMDLAQASEALSLRQSKEDAMWTRLYGAAPTTQSEMADLILDTSSFGIESCVQKVLEALGS